MCRSRMPTEAKDKKTADVLTEKKRGLEKQLGPENLSLMSGLQEIDPESDDGKHRAAGIPCAELSKGLAGVQTGITAKMLSRLLIGVEDVKAVAIANLLDCCR